MECIRRVHNMFRTMKRRKVRLTVALLFILLLSAALVMAIFMWPSVDKTPVESTGHTSSIRLDPGTGEALSGGYEGKTREEILAELQEKQILVTDTISSHASFESGSAGALGEWIVENVPKNSVIQQAEIYLDGSCIARSAAIKPGQHIRQVRLLEAIPSGTYDVVAYLNYFTLDTQSYISKAGFNIKMTVYR